MTVYIDSAARIEVAALTLTVVWTLIGCLAAALFFVQQIELISANNKAWKAVEREKNKTVDVVSVIATCVASNRQLRDIKVAEKSVSCGPFRWFWCQRRRCFRVHNKPSIPKCLTTV